MKILLTIDDKSRYVIKKALLTMKLGFILLLAGAIQASAHAKGQGRISLKMEQTEISAVLNTIEKQGEFRFLYNSQLRDLQQKVSIDVNGEEIKDVLKRLFLGTDLTFKMLENNLIVVLSSSLVNQDIRVTGKVTGENGEPLSGVSVTLKGVSGGTMTSNSGEFSLTVPENGVLVVSYIGYQPQEVPVNSQSVLNIKLVQSTRALDQVVVVGYGTQRKIDVTGSVAHVKGEELAKQPVLTATQAIQGKVAGVQITSSGQPGSSPQVTIRGSGTMLAGANPLLIVDGIWTDDITNINTSDIVSVDILKDASACSIYGVRGANGVILITTRQGSGKMKVAYTATVGMQQAAYVVPMANAKQYIDYYTANTGLPLAPTGYSTNWFKNVLRDAFYQNHNVSISGSSTQDKYALSVGYQTNEGIIIFNDYKRYSIRFNNEFSPATFLKIGTTASFANQNSQNVPVGTITEDAYRASPLVPAMANGKFGNTSQFQNVGNPVLDAQTTNDLSINNRLQGNVYVEIKPIKSIAIKSTFNDELNFYDDRAYTYAHPNDTTFFTTNGGTQGATKSTLNISNNKYYHWVWTNSITFNKDFGASHLSVLAATEAQEYYNVGYTASRLNVPPVPSEWYLQNGDASQQYNNSSVNKYTTNSYFGRLVYNYDDRFLFTGNFRADGSSVFSAQNRWGYFPGVSAGWVITKENFMQNQHIFQYFKLKGSWGELGNSLIPSDAAVYTNISNIPYFFGSGNSGNGATTGSIVPSAAKNLNLKWEVTKESDLGFEFSSIQNRLTGEVDVYDKKATGALIYVYVPGTFGSQANPSSSITPGDIVNNAATIDNKGLEISLHWRDNISKDFSYFIGGNVSFNRNKVVSVNGGLPYFDGNINGYYVTETKAGYPIGSFFMRQAIGVFQSQADIASYVDKNGKELQPGAQPGDLKYKFNDNGQLDTVYAGAYQPKVFFGISGGINYKGFDFSVDIYSNVGNKVYNGKAQQRVSVKDNVEESVATSYWTQQNKSESQPAPNGGNLPASTYFLASGTFFRINNIGIGYTIPANYLNAQKVIKNLRVFLNAQNPVTIKKYGGFSAELPGSSPTNAGIELSTYPTTRTFTFGVNVGL